MLVIPASELNPNATSGGARERGQILVLFALFLVVLIGFAAVAVDLGSYLKVRRDYQNAADAAALAGAPFLVGNTPDRTSARKAAWTSLENQLNITVAGSPWTSDTPAGTPETDSNGTFSLWVSTPPVNAGAKYPGTYTGSDDKSIFVYVQAQSPSYFSHIFGINGSLVSAWATAGDFPSSFAVITLRQPTQAGPAQPDINLAGSNVTLTVVGGDVGGNYNMKLNSSSNLVLPNDSGVYLHDYISCGQSCWGNTQINNGGIPAPFALKTAKQLPGPIPDPNYPLPSNTIGGPIAPTAAGGALPFGYLKNAKDTKSGNGNVNLGSGGDNPDSAHVPSVTTDANGVEHCDTAKAVRIGPGYYTNIAVNGSICLVLDPAYSHSCLSIGTGTGYCTDAPAAIPFAQLPGVFYINGTVSVKGGGMIVGDGVTLVLRPLNSPNDNGQFAAGGGTNSSGIVDLNATEISGGWTRRGVSPYNWVTSGCQYGLAACWQYTSTYESDLTQTGIALYVMRRDQTGQIGIPSDDNTTVVKINASAALTWTGVTYAPHDNVFLAGQPGHNGVGQLVCWTFTFNGGTNVTQTYTGPVVGIPMLIEPYVGQQ